MKKILFFWFLAIGMANAQIRIGAINGDTTTRTTSGLASLAWRNDKLYLVRSSGNTVNFLQNDTRLWVGDNNRVGVGTRTPSQQFEVAGNAKIGGSLQIGVGPGILKTDQNGNVVPSQITATDLPFLGSTYLPLAGGGTVNGTINVPTGAIVTNHLLANTFRLSTQGLPEGTTFENKILKSDSNGFGTWEEDLSIKNLGFSFDIFSWSVGDSLYTTPAFLLKDEAQLTYLSASEANSTYLPLSGGNLTGKTNNIVTENTAYNATTAFQNGNSVGVVNQIYNNSNSTLSYSGLKLTTRSSLPTSWSILNVNAGLGLGDLVFGYGGSSASSERMRLNNSGHLGIGKLPQVALDVAGDISASGRITGSIIRSSSNFAATEYVPVSGTGFRWTLANNNTLSLQQSGDGFATAATNVTFLNNGNVGIGTASPLAKLEVGGSFSQTGAYISARNAGNSFEFGHPNQAGYSSVLGANAGDGSTFIAFNSQAGGISNTYRTRGFVGRLIKNDLGSTKLLFQRVATENADNQSAVTDMTIDNSGNIGIGTTVPENRLQVEGTAQATKFKVSSLNTAPASATATGTVGEIRVTATHIYVCTAANTWVRSALSSW